MTDQWSSKLRGDGPSGSCGPGPPDPLTTVPTPIWRQLRTASKRLVMLDYDGTLADFRVDRLAARPTVDCMRALVTLVRAPDTTVAIFTGRPIKEAQRLLSGLPVIWIGEDGWERALVGGSIDRAPLPAIAVAALAQAHRAASRHSWGVLVERKRSGLMVHTRGLSSVQAMETISLCKSTWDFLVEPGGVELIELDGGIALRAASRDKATAAYWLLCRMPPGSASVYVGDDDDDEPVFGLMRQHGFGLRVNQGGGRTSAHARLPGVQAVTDLLWSLCRGGGETTA